MIALSSETKTNAKQKFNPTLEANYFPNQTQPEPQPAYEPPKYDPQRNQNIFRVVFGIGFVGGNRRGGNAIRRYFFGG